MTKQEIAREMLAVFDGKPERWIQGTYAKSSTGESVPPERSSACCWCVMGALRKVCDDADYDEVFIETAHALERRSGYRALPKWNDAPERTFDDVVKLLTEVAEAAP